MFSRLSLLLFVFFTGCISHSSWLSREIHSDCPQFNSKSLLFVPENQFAGIEVELLRGPWGNLGYLKVYARTIPGFDGRPFCAPFALMIKDERFDYEGRLMSGGQTLLMPDEATDQMICALLGGLDVTVYLKGYRSELSAYKFAKSW